MPFRKARSFACTAENKADRMKLFGVARLSSKQIGSWMTSFALRLWASASILPVISSFVSLFFLLASIGHSVVHRRKGGRIIARGKVEFRLNCNRSRTFRTFEALLVPAVMRLARTLPFKPFLNASRPGGGRIGPRR